MESKNKKLCILVLTMVLSAYQVSSSIAIAQDDTEPVVSSEVIQDDIKANKETFEKAEECITNKDFQSAIVYLTAYINSKPKKYEAYKLRGDAFYALRQFRLAEADYKKAITLKTDDDKFVTGTKVLSAVVLGADKQSQYQNPELGNLYGRLMYAQKALNNPAYESTYEQAFKYNSHIYLPKPKKEDIAKINCPQKYGKVLNPQGVDGYIMDAVSMIEDGQYNEAVYKIQYVTTNYPKYYFGHYLMGVAMSGMEQYDDAVHSFEVALKYNPYDFETFASLGQLFYRKAEKTFSSEDALKSIEYFNKSIKYNPNCHIYYYYIGLNQMIIGDYDLAISSFNSAIKLKSNDYNSMYYKLVAQHIKRDYTSVIDGTTNLLYRHVSNYNSVLYLRALAYYKSGNSDAAVADLEKIHNNMNDIYNDDIRPLSPKEQALSNYLYYLKAKILRDNGLGVKTDLAKAYENPVIASIDKYKQDAIGNVRLTARQVDTEYDYIRTTFNELNLGFTYLNPDYKLVALPTVDVGNQVAQDSHQMKMVTDPIDTISTGQTSIAQMLATQSIGSIQSEPTQIGYESLLKIDSDIEEPSKAEEAIAETVAQVEQVIEEVSNDDNYSEKVENATLAKVEDRIEETTEVKAEEVTDKGSVIEEVVEAKAEAVADKGSVIEEVAESKTEDVLEKVSEVEEVVEAKAEDVSDKVSEIEEVIDAKAEDVTAVVESIKHHAVVEKHAQVDLKEFNTVQSRKVLVLKEDDEIIEFEPISFKEKVEPSVPKVITSTTSIETNKITEEIIKNQQLKEDVAQQEIAKVSEIADEATQTPVDVNITQAEVTTKIAEVPAIVVPPAEVKLPDKDANDSGEDSIEKSFDDVENFDELLAKEQIVPSEKTIEEIIAPEISAVTGETQKKPKKSLFGWLKRNKKASNVVDDSITEYTIEHNKPDDVVSEESVDEGEHVEEDQKCRVIPDMSDERLKLSDQATENNDLSNDEKPLIRLNKAEIEDVESEIEVVEEKKKFTWWWKKDKLEACETQCVPEEKARTRKIDWKKFFTPEPKGKIEEVPDDKTVEEMTQEIIENIENNNI